MQNSSHVFIGTPMFGGNCSGHYVMSLLNLHKALVENGISCSCEFLYNECFVTVARNRLVDAFMKTNATHLLFIDADIKFNAEDVVKMVKADKDIICGVYSRRSIDWNSIKEAAKNNVPAEELKYYTGNLVGNLLNNDEKIIIDEPYEIKHGGTGLMLIKRSVFEQLEQEVPLYRPSLDYLYGGKDEMHREYFRLIRDPENQSFVGEDYQFCELWRQNGGKVFAAPWTRISHVGSYEYSGCII